MTLIHDCIYNMCPLASISVSSPFLWVSDTQIKGKFKLESHKNCLAEFGAYCCRTTVRNGEVKERPGAKYMQREIDTAFN